MGSTGPYEMGSNKSLTRPGGHPLKSFSVPGPPCLSAPNTPTPKHIGTTANVRNEYAKVSVCVYVVSCNVTHNKQDLTDTLSKIDNNNVVQ